MTRRDELRAALDAVRGRIDAACERTGRDPREVRLLPVTKTFPAQDVAALIDVGLRDFAENKDQEAARKAREVAALRPDVPIRWHMVGRLQRNKARSVAGWADEVQSVDSPRLAAALQRAVRDCRDSGERDGTLDVLVQVSMDADPARGGCPIDEVPDLVAEITRSGDLCLRGLMTIAPRGVDHGAVFARFHELARKLRKTHPGLVEVSAGMSGDLESAIAHGSTCVRVGTALLGGRRLTSLE